MASKPADWFDEGNLPILAQYCDLVAEQADLVLRRNELYSTKPADSLERFALIRAKCEVNKAIRDYAATSVVLALRLRLTVQNTIDGRVPRPRSGSRRPGAAPGGPCRAMPATSLPPAKQSPALPAACLRSLPVRPC